MTADGELCKAEFLPALAAGDIVASLAPRAAHRHGGGSSSHCSVCGGSLAARGAGAANRAHEGHRFHRQSRCGILGVRVLL